MDPDKERIFEIMEEIHLTLKRISEIENDIKVRKSNEEFASMLKEFRFSVPELKNGVKSLYVLHHLN